MTDATIASPVVEARGWADHLIRASHRGPGDTVDAAIHRAATKHRLDPRTLWRLRYRAPKDLMASVYLSIKAAYDAECQRQEAKLRHELEITKALPRTPALDAVIRETKALLASMDSQEAGAPSERTGTEG